MPETFEQYRARVLGYLADHDPIRIQRATPGKLERLVASAPRAALRRSPAPGKWSVVEILAHLADAELAYAWRLRIVSARSGAPLLWFDEADWASRFHYQGRRPNQLLRLFRALRDSNLALLAQIPRKKWPSFYGVHERRGRQTLADFVAMEAAHDLNHLRQIAALLRTPARVAGRRG